MAARVIAARAPIERHMTHEFRCMVSSLAMLQACSMASDKGITAEFWHVRSCVRQSAMTGAASLICSHGYR